jgi:hypothetical protein
MKIMLENRYEGQECRRTVFSLCEGSGDDDPGGGAVHHDCVGRGNHAAHEVPGAADGTLQVPYSLTSVGDQDPHVFGPPRS